MPRWETAGALFCLEAFRALLRNKLRSVLAALAIMIGIAAVVCVIAIGAPDTHVVGPTPSGIGASAAVGT